MAMTPREVAESYWRAECSREIDAVLAHFHPDAELIVQPGESHLAGLGVAEDILTTLQGCWEAADRKRAKAARAAARRRAVSPSDV